MKIPHRGQLYISTAYRYCFRIAAHLQWQAIGHRYQKPAPQVYRIAGHWPHEKVEKKVCRVVSKPINFKTKQLGKTRLKKVWGSELGASTRTVLH